MVTSMFVFAMILLYQSFNAFLTYLNWRKMPVVTGTLTALKDCRHEYRGQDKHIVSTTYVYTVEGEADGRHVAEDWTETVRGQKKSAYAVGMEVAMYCDFEKHQAKEVRFVKRDLWVYPLGCAVSVVLMIFFNALFRR